MQYTILRSHQVILWKDKWQIQGSDQLVDQSLIL